MNMKNIMMSLLAGVFVFGTASAVETKIAIVDMQKALQTVEAGKKAKATLEKEFNEKKKVLQPEADSLKKMNEDYRKQSLVLSGEAKAKKEAELQERYMRFREMEAKAQAEISTRERELTEPILRKLQTLVDEVGKSQGYSLILDRSGGGVLFMQSKDDLTEEVIKQFNKKNG